MEIEDIESILKECKLRECPFCGGQAVYSVHFLNERNPSDDKIVFIDVGCPKCDIYFTQMVSLTYDKIEVARYRCNNIVEKWNRRIK